MCGALREETSFTPVEAKYRVYILDEAHMLTTGAVNALLKIMEEPPEHVIFILATTEVHKIPETLLSRCQRFDFKRVPVELIAQRLEEIARQENASVTPEAARRIGELADGGMRDAISLLDQSLSVSRQVELEQINRVAGVVDKEHLFALAQAVQKQDCAGVMERIDQLYQGSFDLDKLCGDLHSHFRDLMLAKTIRPDQLERYVAGTPETRERLSAQAAEFSLSAILHSMTALQQTQSRLTKTSGARMELELCLLSLANPKLDYSLEALLRRVEALEQAVRGMGTPAPLPSSPETAQERSKPMISTPEKEVPNASSQEKLSAAAPVWQPPSQPSEELAPWEDPPALPEEPPLPEPPLGELSGPSSSQKRQPLSEPIEKNPADSRSRLQQPPPPAAKGLEKGLEEFSQWEDVLEALSVSNPALRGALNGSRAYQKGTDLMLIDGSNAFILLIKNSETAKESLREALRAVTGKKFRLGPYKRQKDGESTSRTDLRRCSNGPRSWAFNLTPCNGPAVLGYPFPQARSWEKRREHHFRRRAYLPSAQQEEINMKARLPQGMGGGPGNMNSMIRQAQKMQDDMAKAQEELNAREFTAKAGGGMVEVTILGSKEVKAVKISPEAVDPEDVEMLEDLVTAAVNEAIRTVEETTAAEMQKITGGLNIPGMF